MRRFPVTLWVGRQFRKLEAFLLSSAFEVRKTIRRLGIGRRPFKRLESLRNQFYGKRCFIIGTGPSLTDDDVLKLKNEYTFSVNAMCMKFEELNWTSTFYGFQDEKVFYKFKEQIENAHLQYVFTDYHYRKVISNNEWYYYDRNPYYNSYDAYIRNVYHAKFSDDPVLGIYDGFSVTCSMIQIAVYLGFKEIYLLGCDCNYDEPGKQYYVDHGLVGLHYKEAGNRMTAGYIAAKEYINKHPDIQIYNATRGGKLEVFPRVDLDSLFLKNGDSNA